MPKVVLNTILFLGGTPKFEANAKKWVCAVIRDSSIYFTPV